MANYLYNGIKIDEIPSFPSDYPYLVLVHWSPDNGVPYRLYGCSSRPIITGDNKLLLNEIVGTGLTKYSLVSFYNYVSTDSVDGWDAVYTLGLRTQPIELSGDLAFWTNTDILNPDGTLYLAASTPIPVSAPQLDPLSLLMGWKAGNWVARQRGKA